MHRLTSVFGLVRYVGLPSAAFPSTQSNEEGMLLTIRKSTCTLSLDAYWGGKPQACNLGEALSTDAGQEKVCARACKEGTDGDDCAEVGVGGHVDGGNVAGAHAQERQRRREQHVPHGESYGVGKPVKCQDPLVVHDDCA